AVRDAAGAHVSTMLSWTVITQEEANRRLAEEIMGEVTQIAQFVAEQARLLEAESTRLAEQSDRTVGQTSQGEQIAGGNSANAQTVAAATAQLPASIEETPRQTGDARETASAALEEAERGVEAVAKLEGSSQDIGAVVGLITNIAEQTRLLALNATIEA